jgi:hypothetical protein
MTKADAAFFRRAIARRLTELPPTFTTADTEALKARVLAMLDSKTTKYPTRPAPLNAPEEK